jgi:hypothetical protein
MVIKGVIYELTCLVTGDNYIGSTTQTLKERLRLHDKQSRDSGKNSKTNKAIREYGVDNFSIEPLFIRTVKKIHKLREFEGRTIEKRQPTLNMRITGLFFNKDGIWNEKLSASDWYQKNKDRISKQQAEYRKENRDKISKYDAERYRKKTTCECGIMIASKYKSGHIRTNKHKSLMSDKLNTPQRCEYPPS